MLALTMYLTERIMSCKQIQMPEILLKSLGFSNFPSREKVSLQTRSLRYEANLAHKGIIVSSYIYFR